MNKRRIVSLLNRLYALERHSLANYLRYSDPWTPPQSEPLRAAISQIADEHQDCADQVGMLLVERDGDVQEGVFPFRFTAFNDLSIEYLAPRVLEEEERLVDQVRRIADELVGDLPAHSLALEVLEKEERHVAQLRELLAVPAPEAATRQPLAEAAPEPAVSTAA